MSRLTIRIAVAGGALAATALCGGTAFAADYGGVSGGGAGSTPGTTSGSGGSSGGSLSPASTTTSGGSGAGTTSNGGTVSGSGTSSGGSGSLPFTGFELATALTLGAGAIGAGSAVVVASRRRRTSATA
jgi:hypothetical protein